MAIRKENGHLIIDCGDYTSFDTAHIYIVSLLNLLQSCTEDDRFRTEDVFYVCELINHLLPTSNEFHELSRKYDK